MDHDLKPVQKLGQLTEVSRLSDRHASIDINHERAADNLREGIASRQVIGQAFGLLMAEHQLNEEAAWATSRRRSARANVTVGEAQALDVPE